jgi:hypothetical protein
MVVHQLMAELVYHSVLVELQHIMQVGEAVADGYRIQYHRVKVV